MNPNKALWEKGDFTRLAATMRESGDALIESLKKFSPDYMSQRIQPPEQARETLD